MNERAVEEMWSSFATATGADGSHTAWAFGDESDPDMATRLGKLVVDGPKRATAGLLADYEEGGEPIPSVGEYSVILDGAGEPLCIIETIEVEVRRFGDVDERFAWDEGEGDRTLEWWREAHMRFFERIGRPVDDESLVVLERFELVWPA